MPLCNFYRLSVESGNQKLLFADWGKLLDLFVSQSIWGGRWSDTMTRLSLNALLKTDPESLFSAELTAFCGLRFCCFSGS